MNSELKPAVSAGYQCDVFVVGAGMAGLTLALSIAEQRSVLVVCKGVRSASASNYAQGGISAVYSDCDTHEKHFTDTIVAGCDLNSRDNTWSIITEGRSAVEWLIQLGVPFTREGTDYHLTREGGHSERRILHVDDMTGRGIQTTLLQHCEQHPNITLLEDHFVADLLREDGRCIGGTLIDGVGREVRVCAGHTVIATGGIGAVFKFTTSPSNSVGGGVALAWRLGCRVANLEFMQFHPTCMYYPEGGPFLITEAVRGEGGILSLPNGHRFMSQYDSRGDLAPRDVVARAIYSEMRKHALPAVNLNISHMPADFVKSHFPNIYRECLDRGVDMTVQPIQVTPASHYTCGGVMTNSDGLTDVPNLFCVGEAAYTGLHGANRLASNSLLECVVMARSAARAILKDAVAAKALPAAGYTPTLHLSDNDAASRTDALALLKSEIRTIMWNYVGIVRSRQSLYAAQRRLGLIEHELNFEYRGIARSVDFMDLQNLATSARLVIECALARRESRGCHYDTDYPMQSDIPEPTVLSIEAMQTASVA